MKILVTGAAGMLGTDLVKRLTGGGHDVTGVDRTEFDILDELSVRDAVAGIRPDWVIHCAAFTSVDVCEKESETAFRVNADGARNIAKACWGAGAKMLYISTDYVYDGSKREPYIETDPVRPLSVYGKSKLKGEEEILKVLPEALIVRTSWLFGANGPNFVKAILGQVGVKDELSVVDDQMGSPTYTPDLADALTRLVEASAKGIFHAANEGQCTWFDYAKRILEIAGAAGITVKPITTEQLARPANRPAYSVLSKAKYTSVTGHVMRTWDAALNEYMTSIRKG